MGLDIGGGIIGLIVLAFDVWAIINVIGSSVSLVAKILWILAILLLPIIGLIAWLIAGPRKGAVTA